MNFNRIWLLDALGDEDQPATCRRTSVATESTPLGAILTMLFLVLRHVEPVVDSKPLLSLIPSKIFEVFFVVATGFNGCMLPDPFGQGLAGLRSVRK